MTDPLGNPFRVAAKHARAQREAVRIGGQELELGSPVAERVAAEARGQYLARRAVLAPLPPASERSLMAEAVWQKQVVALAKRLGFYVYHPKLSRWSARGFPDLSLFGSRALWIECKTDDGQLTEAQVEVISRMLACGLEVHVLRPWHTLQRVAEVLQHGR